MLESKSSDIVMALSVCASDISDLASTIAAAWFSSFVSIEREDAIESGYAPSFIKYQSN